MTEKNRIKLKDLREALREFDGFDKSLYAQAEQRLPSLWQAEDQGCDSFFSSKLSIAGVDIQLLINYGGLTDSIRLYGRKKFEPQEDYKSGTLLGDAARKIAAQQGVGFADMFYLEKGNSSIEEITRNVKSIINSQSRLETAIERYKALHDQEVNLLIK